MATLTRVQPSTVLENTHHDGEILLDSRIPEPFPMEALRDRNRHNLASESVNVEEGSLLEDLAGESLELDPFADSANVAEGVQVNESEDPQLVNRVHLSNILSQSSPSSCTSQAPLNKDLLASLIHVQHSCLMTLNNLLSSLQQPRLEWQSITPRRHSMPSRTESGSSPITQPDSSTSALSTVVTNLRNLQDYGAEFAESSTSAVDDTPLIVELRRRVETLTATMPQGDAHLATSLVSLLSHANRLTSMGSNLYVGNDDADLTSTTLSLLEGDEDVYEKLKRQVLELQNRRMEQEFMDSDSTQGISPVLRVESALLWTQIDMELEAVSSMCRERNEIPEQLPPEYMDDFGDRESLYPPLYEDSTSASFTHEKEKNTSTLPSSQIAPSSMNEKMRLDFEAVTQAIDRLYLVAPQLHSQRVELKKAKVEELERARNAGASSTLKKKVSTTNAKGKAKDTQELEKLMDLLGKASSRRMIDQSVVLENGMQPRIERAIRRDIANKEAFVEKLVNHGSSRRLTSQDAVFHHDRAELRNPDAMLTLPEFIRERIPDDCLKQMEHQQFRDPDALLSLPEFVKEPPPPDRIEEEEEEVEEEDGRRRSHSSKHSITSIKSVSSKSSKKSERSAHGSAFSRFSRKGSKIGLRARSLSAPPLAWLLPTLSRSSSASMLRSATQQQQQPQTDSKPTPISKGLTVRYVAEHHENLQHVVIFLGVDEGMIPGKNLEAEVMPMVGDSSKGDRIVLTCGHHASPPLGLPVPVLSGKKEVKVHGGHYEIKLLTETRLSEEPIDASSMSGFLGLSLESSLNEPPSLLDATHLTSLQPTSFICASCSLALVHPPSNSTATSPTSPSSTSSSPLIFRDLPSEHWEEFLESWMCHGDQRLNDSVIAQGQGFCPEKGHALVGGSYVLFEESSVVANNFKEVGVSAHGDEWRRVHCICGTIIGRCRTHKTGYSSTVVYRFAKYALRPVGSSAEPTRVPFSAFVLEDMIELMRAHASYRFVVMDEEEEKPRLLVWLFKPSMRLSYATTAQFALPRTGSIQAAKVLFKIIGPEYNNTDMKTILEKYPGFPQAERLLYPMDICRRLAALLRESNTSYPIGMRVMTGLLVGWLRRA